MALTDKLTNIADAIRSKTGSTDSLTLDAMPEAIEGIETGSTAVNGKFTELMNKSLKTITAEDLAEVTALNPYVFYGCEALTNITIPNHITSIGEGALQKCTGLTNIAIPNSVISLDKYALADCTKLTSIVLPSSVNSIGTYAFSRCIALTNAVLPDGLETINTGLFYNCTNLTSITIPSSVTKIDYEVFSNCKKITDVYYKGTEEQWAAIEMKASGNTYLIDATIHYNS